MHWRASRPAEKRAATWQPAGAAKVSTSVSGTAGFAHRTGPALREQGLLFVGLDVIGDYLTEINVTSPTCIRELDTLLSTQISPAS